MNIAGATGNTYITTQDDVGRTIRAVASYTDDGGSLEALASTPTAAVTDVNDAPTLVNNRLTVLPGATVTLTTADLSAVDIDDGAVDLAFTVSAVTGGQFELTSASGVEITNFTRNQISAGTVVFIDDGDGFAPSYDVAVSDGMLVTAPAAATITFASGDAVTADFVSAPSSVPSMSLTPPTVDAVTDEPDKASKSTAAKQHAAAEDTSEAGSENTDEVAEEELLSTAEDEALVVETLIDDDGDRFIGASGNAISLELRALLNTFAGKTALQGAALSAQFEGLDEVQIAALVAELDQLIGSTEFNDDLDRLRRELDDSAMINHQTVGASVAISGGLSVGYVAWLLRSGVLLSTVLSSLPAWQFVDPLPVLARTGRVDDDEADDSLEEIIAQRAEQTETKQDVDVTPLA